jgi:subtilisin family serine protease
MRIFSYLAVIFLIVVHAPSFCQSEGASIAVENEYLVKKSAEVDLKSFTESLSSAVGRQVTIIEDLGYDQLLRIRIDNAPSRNVREKASTLVSQSFTLASASNVLRLEPLVSFRLTDISSDHTRTTVAVKQIMQRIGLSSILPPVSIAPNTAPLEPQKPVIIAVIDSGVALDHEVFDDLLLPGVDVTAGDNFGFSARAANAKKLPNGQIESHGTTVAGLVALAVRGGTLNGKPMANIKILPIRATTFQNGVERVLSSDAIKAVNLAILKGARFINASWGDGGDSTELKKIFYKADASNITIVTAAGNGKRGSVFEEYKGYDIDAPGNAVFPASWRLPNMIAVAALDVDERLAAFSNWGGSSVQLAAPGVAVIAPVPDDAATTGAKISSYQAHDGTSVAAPLVTAVLGIYSAQNPNVTSHALVSRIVGSAFKSDDLKTKVVSSGRLSGLRLINMKETPTLPARAILADAYKSSISESAALALVRVSPQAERNNDAPILRMTDANGSYVKTPKDMNFLVRTKSNVDAQSLSNAISYGLGSINEIRKIDNNLYSVSVESVGDSKVIEGQLKKAIGVSHVEKETQFILQ